MSSFNRAKQNHLLYYQPILDKEGYIQSVNSKGQTVYVRKRQLGSNLEREVLVYFGAKNLLQNAFYNSASSVVDSDIQQHLDYKIDDLILTFSVTNQTSSTITLAPAIFCFDRIEIII